MDTCHHTFVKTHRTTQQRVNPNKKYALWLIIMFNINSSTVTKVPHQCNMVTEDTEYRGEMRNSLHCLFNFL